MTEQKVQIYLCEDQGHSYLILRQKSKEDLIISIFSGSGYYTDFMFQTRKEIEESEAALKLADEKWTKEMMVKTEKRDSKKWYQFWK